MNNISFKQYRAIDLGILAVILFAVEALIAKAAGTWFTGQLYTLSPTIAIVCIVMMRWGGYAAIHAAAGGLAFCIASGASPQQFAIYCAGNCFALVSLLLIKKFGKQKIKDSVLLTILFTVTAFFGVQIGRWLVSLAFGGAVDTIIVFIMTDSLTLVFSVLVVLISRRIDGLFEDQKAYLIRTAEERRRAELTKLADEPSGDPDNYE